NFTSSTSGRTWWNEDGLLKSEHKAIAFAAYNQSNWEQDIAKGRGEYLASMSSLLGVSEGERSAFALGTQSQFQSLVGGDDVARLHSLRALVKKRARVRPKCFAQRKMNEASARIQSVSMPRNRSQFAAGVRIFIEEYCVADDLDRGACSQIFAFLAMLPLPGIEEGMESGYRQ